MAFEGLTEKLNAAFKKLRGKGRLTENDVREAMRELVRQAGENDNISTIYVVDRQEQYYGAIELQDLIIATELFALCVKLVSVNKLLEEM